MDLAGKDYWERVWGRPRGRGVERFSYFYQAFTRLLARHALAGSTACEVGCGSSVWVPFLAACGVQMTGIDYSETGLQLLRQMLQEKGVHAELIQGDVFDSDSLPASTFDMMFSLGFVEHFDDGVSVIARMSRALKPGGTMVTLVPNLVGIWGPVQQRLDLDVFNVHKLYSAESLDAVHEAAGLQRLHPARYFGGVGASSVNYSKLLARRPVLTRWTMRAVWLMQQAISWPASVLPGSGESRLLSAYVVGVYRKPVVP